MQTIARVAEHHGTGRPNKSSDTQSFNRRCAQAAIGIDRTPGRIKALLQQGACIRSAHYVKWPVRVGDIRQADKQREYFWIWLMIEVPAVGKHLVLRIDLRLNMKVSGQNDIFQLEIAANARPNCLDDLGIEQLRHI